MRYSFQPRDRIFKKGYGSFSFAKNMCKNIGKNLSKKFSGKYSEGMLATYQKFLCHAKQSATDALIITIKKVIQKILKKSNWQIDW